MSPVVTLLLSLFVTQDLEAPTNPPPAPAAAVEPEYPIPSGAPSDDYGLVAWCYGALASHMALYDKVIPEVERIEVSIAKIPGAAPADMNSYAVQQEAGRDMLKQFRRAMEAAERASPKPISTYGAQALKQGGTVWSMFKPSDRKLLAREWMSWGLPGRCLQTSERLEARSGLFGQALSFNSPGARPAAAAAPKVFEPEPETPFGPVSTASSIDDLLPGEDAPVESPETPALRGPL
jgi:hypothetical protein